MKLIKIVITFSILLISKLGHSQTLGIQETVKYINKLFYDNRSGNYYDEISLSNEGILKIYFNYSKWTYQMEISEVYVNYMEKDNKFKIVCKQPENQNGNFYNLQPTTKCIQIDVATGIIQQPTNYMIISIDNIYNNKKLHNAFQYLFTIVEENGTYTRKDDDPFAPNKFKLNKNEIVTTTNIQNIKLEKIGNIYYLPITIGKTIKKFVLDSGASDVLISEEIESELIKNMTITKDNYMAPALYKIADGSIIQCRRILIPEIKIGNYTIKNVIASIGNKSNTLLLGKSLLDKFANWTIDNNNQTLNL